MAAYVQTGGIVGELLQCMARSCADVGGQCMHGCLLAATCVVAAVCAGYIMVPANSLVFQSPVAAITTAAAAAGVRQPGHAESVGDQQRNRHHRDDAAGAWEPCWRPCCLQMPVHVGLPLLMQHRVACYLSDIAWLNGTTRREVPA
jgi:hypothetical protein